MIKEKRKLEENILLIKLLHLLHPLKQRTPLNVLHVDQLILKKYHSPKKQLEHLDLDYLVKRQRVNSIVKIVDISGKMH